MPGSDLHLAPRDPGLQSAHDERRPQHVGVDLAEAGPLGDGAHPSVGGAPVEAAAVVPEKHRTRCPLGDWAAPRTASFISTTA